MHLVRRPILILLLSCIASNSPGAPGEEVPDWRDIDCLPGDAQVRLTEMAQGLIETLRLRESMEKLKRLNDLRYEIQPAAAACVAERRSLDGALDTLFQGECHKTVKRFNAVTDDRNLAQERVDRAIAQFRTQMWIERSAYKRCAPTGTR